MSFVKGFFIGLYAVVTFHFYNVDRLTYLGMLAFAPLFYLLLMIGVNECRKILK